MSQHIYNHPNGNKVPSPTGIIGQLDKPALVYWAANCACDYILEELKQRPFSRADIYPIVESARKNFRKVSSKALDIGSAVHEAVQRYLEHGQQPEAPSDEVMSGFLAFLEWEKQHHLEVIKTEHTVYDPKGLFAGTLDLLCYLNSKKYVIDFKTTKQPRNNKPYPEWEMQLSAYASCIEDVEGIGIVRLDKETGEPDFYDLTSKMESAMKIFNILTDLWYARHPKYQKGEKK